MVWNKRHMSKFQSVQLCDLKGVLFKGRIVKMRNKSVGILCGVKKCVLRELITALKWFR